MTKTSRFVIALIVVFVFTSMLPYPAKVQSGGIVIDGRLQTSNKGQIMGVRVRLILQNTGRPIADTFSRSDGQFTFTYIPAGDYIIETFKTEHFEATTTNVNVQPVPGGGTTVIPVFIELPTRLPLNAVAASVVMVDVDLHVPKDALKHYRAAAKALESKDSARSISELEAAIKIHPDYFAARLELGRELRKQRRFQEAEETLKPLRQIAAKRAEPHVEYGLVLLALGRLQEAIGELRAALQLNETDWATHFFLGLALLETDAAGAEQHFQRAVKLGERKAARAHIGLARIAIARGLRQLAIEHLNAYLTLLPNAPDAEAIRKRIERLRPEK